MKQITFNNVKAKNIVTGEEREIPAITGRNYDREISDINDRIDDLELFKFPNVTIIGTPTINHGQISGFSNSSYLKFPFLVDFRNHSFEIKMAFTTGTNVTSQENIFDSDFGLAFAIRSGKFVIAVSTNGTNWDLGEGVGTYSVQPNTTYYVRLGWDLTNYYLSYSLDGSAFINDINRAGTSQPYPKQIFIGVGENFTTVVNHFTGTINLNHATLQIGDEIVWSGMDDAGLSTRADVSLSNIDEAGEQKIRDIVGDGSNEEYELIREITLEEESTQILIDVDNLGQPFSLKKVYIEFNGYYTDITSARNGIYLSSDKSVAPFYYDNIGSGNSGWSYEIYPLGSYFYSIQRKFSSSTLYFPVSTIKDSISSLTPSDITVLRLDGNQSHKYAVGTNVKVYGIKS